MDISKFIDKLEKRQKGCVRKINVEIIDGKKKPNGEHKDWSIEQILKDRGSWSSVGDKTFSISVTNSEASKSVNVFNSSIIFVNLSLILILSKFTNILNRIKLRTNLKKYKKLFCY